MSPPPAKKKSLVLPNNSRTKGRSKKRDEVTVPPSCPICQKLGEKKRHGVLPDHRRTKAGVNRHDVTVPPAALPTKNRRLPSRKNKVKSQTDPPFFFFLSRWRPLAETIQKPDHVTAYSFRKKSVSAPFQKPSKIGMMTLFTPARPSLEKKQALALPPKQGQKLNRTTKKKKKKNKLDNNGETSLTFAPALPSKKGEKHFPSHKNNVKKNHRRPQKKKKIFSPREGHSKAGPRHCFPSSPHEKKAEKQEAFPIPKKGEKPNRPPQKKKKKHPKKKHPLAIQKPDHVSVSPSCPQKKKKNTNL